MCARNLACEERPKIDAGNYERAESHHQQMTSDRAIKIGDKTSSGPTRVPPETLNRPVGAAAAAADDAAVAASVLRV